jgi:FkbM family methyltransferase
MSRFDRFVGIARSVAIYHAIPFRQRRLRRLYAEFVKPGDLVFDIGAHAGNRARGFAALGCRVIALEPQPDFAQLLRWLFGRSTRIEIVEAAAGAVAGRASLSISDRTPTVTTTAASWREARSREAEFGGVRWNRRIEVVTTTLDLLIERCGMPAFIKIDVEGGEPEVLAGLTQAVPALSFEYLPGATNEVRACISRLSILGRYLFNWSAGESFRLASSSWLSGDELLACLEAPRDRLRSGDVYALLQTGLQNAAG